MHFTIVLKFNDSLCNTKKNKGKFFNNTLNSCLKPAPSNFYRFSEFPKTPTSTCKFPQTLLQEEFGFYFLENLLLTDFFFPYHQNPMLIFPFLVLLYNSMTN